MTKTETSIDGNGKILSTNESKLLQSLLSFYATASNMEAFIDTVVLKTNNIPLTVYEWLVTNYSKKNDIRYQIKRPNGRIEKFVVYDDYNAHISGNKKSNFDPYCRGPSIELKYTYPDTGEQIVFQTAIRQLTFFKWAIQNLVVDYVNSNHEAIYDDWSASRKKTDKTGKALSKSIYKGFYCTDTITNPFMVSEIVQ